MEDLNSIMLNKLCNRLDCVDCRIAKSKEIRICDGFKDKEYRVVAQTQKQGKLPKKEEQKQKEQIISLKITSKP